MKRFIGTAVANWLRKPENREKAKRTAKQFWSKYQHRKAAPGSKPGNNAPKK